MLDSQTFDAVTYRNGMALYAGHVQIVTTAQGAVRRGVTITAACSVSDKPPMVLVCLNNSNANNQIFAEAGCFALNTIGSGSQALADAFSGRTGLSAEERFALGQWKTLVTGAPVLEDAIVSFDCRIAEIRPMSTHDVYFGEVVGMHFGKKTPPLIYLDRAYHAL